MLIRAARLRDGRLVDVELAAGLIATVSEHRAGETGGFAANGGLLLPGLYDHHVHIAATAAAQASVRCGPPEVVDARGLARALVTAPGHGWLRGVGYHESVAGELDRAWLDRVPLERPVRVQHRSGRMWIFNSAALDLLVAAAAPPEGLNLASGQLFDDDAWLRRALASAPPDLTAASQRWSEWGVTGLTDMNPLNGPAEAAWLATQQRNGALAQRLIVAGQLSLGDCADAAMLRVGPYKVHLHEAHLPDYEGLIAAIRAAHRQGRGAAVHCVTETELVFALSALREAGVMHLDRIEHASVAPDELIAQIAQLGLAVVTQPHFVSERGDAYLADIPSGAWDTLYRLRSFVKAEIPLAAGSDAPFGSANPWAAMAAAVARTTAAGAKLGSTEALRPDEALGLFLADPFALGSRRSVEPGAPADLCLLAQDWSGLEADLAGATVVATFVAGEPVYGLRDRI